MSELKQNKFKKPIEKPGSYFPKTKEGEIPGIYKPDAGVISQAAKWAKLNEREAGDATHKSEDLEI